MSLEEQSLDAASRCPLSRAAIAQLAVNLPVEAGDQLVRRALEERGPETATALGFALAMQGAKLNDNTLVNLLRETESHNIVPLLSHLSSDIAKTAIELVERGKFPHERESLALCAVARALAVSNQAAPNALVGRIRTLIRLSPVGVATYLRIAAESLGETVLAEKAPWAPPRFVNQTRSEIDRALSEPSASLPEYAPPPVLRGFTVRHVTAKVGRNDPCPCNSGAKYKKCCGASGKVAELNAVGLTPEHFAPGNASLISEQQFRRMRPHELAQLNPNELDDSRVVIGIRTFSSFCRWQLAEQWTSELTSREAADAGWWEDLGNEALAAGEVELAQRCLAKLETDDPEFLSLKLAIRAGSPLLDQFETALREDLRGAFADHQYTIAFGLVDKYPALGTLVARGCLSAERPFDSEMLLRTVDEARDALGLAGEEPYWTVFETMLEADEAQASNRRLSETEQARLLALQAKLEQSRSEAAGLKRDLLAQQQLLRGAQSHQQKLTPPQPTREPDAEHQQRLEAAEQERLRLQSRVNELKARLKEEVNERHALRDTLKQLRSEEAQSSNGQMQPANTTPEDSGHEEPLSLAEAVPLRRPTITERQFEALKALDGDLGRKAIHLLGDLCSGTTNAWHQVKRLKKSRDTFSARLGIHHRLLFTCTPTTLQLEAVVPRKDLDRYVASLVQR